MKNQTIQALSHLRPAVLSAAMLVLPPLSLSAKNSDNQAYSLTGVAELGFLAAKLVI